MTQSYLPPLAPYPTTRLRRNRRDPWSRKLVAESVLTAGDGVHSKLPETGVAAGRCVDRPEDRIDRTIAGERAGDLVSPRGAHADRRVRRAPG